MLQVTVRRHRGGWRELLLCLAALFVSGCGIPTVTFIGEPDRLAPLGNERRFRHDTVNDNEDFRGYELYYKIYNANDTDAIVADEGFIESQETPGIARLLTRNFLRMVRTQSGTPDGFGIETPPMLPVALSQRDTAFEVTVSFAELEQTVVVNNPGEASGSAIPLFRQNVLLDDQTTGTEFDRFLDQLSYEYIVNAQSGNDADLAEMLGESFDDVGQYVAAVVVISFGIDATNFQRIYSTPVHLGTVTLF